MTDPIKHMAHPSFPNVPNSSFRKYDPNTAPIRTLNAPRGVTRIAGAKAYAAKFAISPIITVNRQRRARKMKWSAYMIQSHPTILDSSDMKIHHLRSHVSLLHP